MALACEAVQKYIEDTSTLANEASNQAPSILPKLEDWRDLKKSFSEYGLSTADAKAIAGPIFTGTLEDSKVYSDSELRGLFNLNAKQIGQYREFRNAVDTSLDQMVAVDVLRLLGDKNPALQAIAQEDRPAFRAGVDEFLTKQAADATSKAMQEKLTALRDEVREKYRRVDDLKAQGYAPLMRFGRYTINIPGADGESHAPVFACPFCGDTVEAARWLRLHHNLELPILFDHVFHFLAKAIVRIDLKFGSVVFL